MVIKLNLKVGAKYKTASKREQGLEHYIIFAIAAAFLLVSAAVILLGSWKLYSLSEDRKALEARRVTVTQNIKLMETELARLDTEAAVIDNKLNFMLDEVPAVEVMTSLDPLIPKGIYLESLTLNKGYAVYKGIALEEEDVTVFVNRLSRAPSTLSIEVPDIKPTKIKNTNVRSFSIRCAINSIKDILNVGVVPEINELGDTGGASL
ncbi:MAG: PilN domain-containing protein [Synergistota bacterium]|nr:PilN domain-containing protein [Synergistota bacterium]